MSARELAATRPGAARLMSWRDALGAGCAWAGGAVVVGALLAIVVSVARAGAGAVDLAYLTGGPARAGLAGGVASVIVSTVLLVVVAVVAAAPAALLTAILLYEATRTPRVARFVSRSLDVLACVPSIVFGLFGLKLFCELLGLGWSILAGGLTLACMIMPVLVRAAEQALRDVAVEQRLACAALGTSRAGALLHVVIPAAAPGIVAGLLLGTGRALAETAAVLFTAGASLHMPERFLDPGRALAVHVYTLAIEVPGGAPRAASAALVLLVVVTLTNVAVHVAGAAFRRWRLGARA